jgi:formamidopyrimidine-DNA glycosylase
MPELPDIELYLDALRRHVVGHALSRVRIASPFLLRSVDVPPEALVGHVVHEVSRLGKRIVFGFATGTERTRAPNDELFAVLHLMIAGRLRWREAGARIPGRLGLAAFDFPHGTLLVTEAGSRKRAALHLVRGRAAVEEMDPGGLEVLTASLEDFATALRRENHTLKRALTDPRILSGIGNAYSDEILHAASLSPMILTGSLSDAQMQALFAACRTVLTEWSARLREEAGATFPEHVTAFRPGMAVHGRHGQPCPRCGAPVQRIVYASNEANYCAACQTGGRLLADRALSRLLRDDWPKTLEELERRRKADYPSNSR